MPSMSVPNALAALIAEDIRTAAFDLRTAANTLVDNGQHTLAMLNEGRRPFSRDSAAEQYASAESRLTYLLQLANRPGVGLSPELVKRLLVGEVWFDYFIENE